MAWGYEIFVYRARLAVEAFIRALREENVRREQGRNYGRNYGTLFGRL